MERLFLEHTYRWLKPGGVRVFVIPGDINRAKAKLSDFAKVRGLARFAGHSRPHFIVPPSNPVELVYRGLPLDVVEDLLPTSGAYRQAARVLFAPELRATERPLTPLHGGRVGTITDIADLSCKPLKKRLLSRWRHSIVKMFYWMRLLLPLFAPAH